MRYSIDSVNAGIDDLIDEINNLQTVNEIIKNAYLTLYNTVDKMFIDIGNQWENDMDIEVVVGDLRRLIYQEEL